IKTLSVTALFTFVEMLPAAVYAQSPAAIPDFSGLWARATFGFEPPETGNGPIRNLMRQSDGTEDRSRTVGDFRDPNLKPKAAAVLKRNGETALSGSDYPTPNNQCR